MKRLFFAAMVVLMTLAFSSCEEKQNAVRKDRSAGGTAEILIVTQNDEQWEGMIGDTIRRYFMDYQYGLPQPEPMNNLAHVNLSGFSDMFRKHKSILEVEINPSLEKAVVETAEDMWASPQRYVKISAPNRAQWVEQFESKKDVFKLWYDKVDRARIINVFRPSVDVNVVNAIERKFGFRMVVPQGFFVGKSETDFMWIRKELDRSSACILIYRTPYSDTAQFETNSLVNFRNRMVEQYIPGPLEGSYMTTETEFVPPMVSYASDFPANYAVEMRGMWRVENDFMGGPFVSYSFVDDRFGDFVTVEGYYYEPNQKKRNQLLQLEAILYSLRFTDVSDNQ